MPGIIGHLRPLFKYHIFCREVQMDYDPERFEPVKVDHEGVAYETDKAKLFRIGQEKVWVPKSQISEEEGDEDGGAFWVPKWLAEENGFECE